MTSDLDIFRSASVLIKRYGEDALLEATARADAMLEKAHKRVLMMAGNLIGTALKKGICLIWQHLTNGP